MLSCCPRWLDISSSQFLINPVGYVMCHFLLQYVMVLYVLYLCICICCDQKYESSSFYFEVSPCWNYHATSLSTQVNRLYWFCKFTSITCHATCSVPCIYIFALLPLCFALTSQCTAFIETTNIVLIVLSVVLVLKI